jgi:hypothetical protein
VTTDEHVLALCSEHRQLLLEEPGEFRRLWGALDPRPMPPVPPRHPEQVGNAHASVAMIVRELTSTRPRPATLPASYPGEAASSDAAGRPALAVRSVRTPRSSTVYARRDCVRWHDRGPYHWTPECIEGRALVELERTQAATMANLRPCKLCSARDRRRKGMARHAVSDA